MFSPINPNPTTRLIINSPLQNSPLHSQHLFVRPAHTQPPAMGVRAAAAAAAACHRALRAKLSNVASELRGYYCFLGATTSAALVVALAALLCAVAAYPRAAASLLPLAATTSLCCAVAGLFDAEVRGAAGEDDAVEAVVRVGGGPGGLQGKAEAGLVQVIGEANASAYGGGGGGLQVGCFLRRSARAGVDDDGEEVVFAGTLAPRCVAGGAAGEVEPLGHGGLEEEVAAMRVDRMAEGVWNSYFGGWSTWHDVDAAVC
ncbi:unnamed protein product [Urochloa decumbens]|uniref:Uncharacterized protein n=1 Tax=Urochloa decumbens TaxID=240449 RepID=A0ABC8YYE7_9POAL